MPTVEKWKRISTHPNYEISSAGRVRNRQTGHILSCTKTGGGYLKVNLGNGSKSTQRVNRLVAFAFLGEPPNGRIYCHHKNHQPDDNRIENLEWVTPEENSTAAHKFYGNRADVQRRLDALEKQIKQMKEECCE